MPDPLRSNASNPTAGANPTPSAAYRGIPSPQSPLPSGAKAHPALASGAGWLPELSTSSLRELPTPSSMPDRRCCAAANAATPLTSTAGANPTTQPPAATTIEPPPRPAGAFIGKSQSRSLSPQLPIDSGTKAHPPLASGEGRLTKLSTSSLRELLTPAPEALDA
jgi:hypothetical protein